MHGRAVWRLVLQTHNSIVSDTQNATRRDSVVTRHVSEVVKASSIDLSTASVCWRAVINCDRATDHRHQHERKSEVLMIQLREVRERLGEEKFLLSWLAGISGDSRQAHGDAICSIKSL